jgi:hypothetical protein
MMTIIIIVVIVMRRAAERPNRNHCWHWKSDPYRKKMTSIIIIIGIYIDIIITMWVNGRLMPI